MTLCAGSLPYDPIAGRQKFFRQIPPQALCRMTPPRQDRLQKAVGVDIHLEAHSGRQ